MSKELSFNEVNKKGNLVAHVGLQNRGVYEVDGTIYEQGISWSDGQAPEFFKTTEERAEELRNLPKDPDGILPYWK